MGAQKKATTFHHGKPQAGAQKKHRETHKKKHKGPPQNPLPGPRHYFLSRETTSGSTKKRTAKPTRKSTKDHRKTQIGAQKKAPQNLTGGPTFENYFPFRNSSYLPQDPPQKNSKRGFEGTENLFTIFLSTNEKHIEKPSIK